MKKTIALLLTLLMILSAFIMPISAASEIPVTLAVDTVTYQQVGNTVAVEVTLPEDNTDICALSFTVDYDPTYLRLIPPLDDTYFFQPGEALLEQGFVFVDDPQQKKVSMASTKGLDSACTLLTLYFTVIKEIPGISPVSIVDPYVENYLSNHTYAVTTQSGGVENPNGEGTIFAFDTAVYILRDTVVPMRLSLQSTTAAVESFSGTLQYDPEILELVTQTDAALGLWREDLVNSATVASDAATGTLSFAKEGGITTEKDLFTVYFRVLQFGDTHVSMTVDSLTGVEDGKMLSHVVEGTVTYTTISHGEYCGSFHYYSLSSSPTECTIYSVLPTGQAQHIIPNRLPFSNTQATVTAIASNAYKSHIAMTSVMIPASVKEIGYGAFGNCVSLTDVYYEGTEEQWNTLVIHPGNQPLENATLHFSYEIPVTITDVTLGENHAQTKYNIGEPLNPQGLTLILTNSDGTTQEVTTGYTLSGYDPNTAGIQAITVHYEGFTLHYNIYVYDPENPTVGDVNGDFLVNAKDALLVLKYAVGKAEIPEDMQPLADVNGDGNIDAKDALAVLKHAVGTKVIP